MQNKTFWHLFFHIVSSTMLYIFVVYSIVHNTLLFNVFLKICSVDIHLGCFWVLIFLVLAIMNNATVNICACAACSTYSNIRDSPGYTLCEELQNYTVCEHST